MLNPHSNRSRHESELGPKRSKRRARVMGAGLATAGILGGVAATTLAQAVPASASQPHDAAPAGERSKSIRGYVQSAPGTPAMTLISLNHLNDFTFAKQPMALKIQPGAKANFDYFGLATFRGIGVDFRYAIDGTNYRVYGKAEVPFIGDNRTFCEIRNNANDAPAPDSPYKCTYTFNPRGYDPQPNFTIAPKG
jgi:hypothetical protein